VKKLILVADWRLENPEFVCADCLALREKVCAEEGCITIPYKCYSGYTWRLPDRSHLFLINSITSRGGRADALCAKDGWQPWFPIPIERLIQIISQHDEVWEGELGDMLILWTLAR